MKTITQEKTGNLVCMYTKIEDGQPNLKANVEEYGDKMQRNESS